MQLLLKDSLLVMALAPVYIGMVGMGDEYAHQHSFTRQGVHFLVRMRSTLHTHMRMACTSLAGHTPFPSQLGVWPAILALA